jgi:NitT/TauT family transport system substrate-binding protein
LQRTDSLPVVEAAVQIRVAVPYHVVYYAPFFLALNRGLFGRQGIDVEAQISGPVSPAVAMQRGAIEIGVGGIMRSLVAYDRGEPFVPVHFARINDRDGFFLLGTVADFRWSDLTGKRIIVFGEAPTPWYVLRAVLRRQGLDPDQVQALEDVPLADGPSAFRERRGDYLLTQAHVAEELIRSGEAFLLRSMAEEAGPLPYSSYYARPEFLDTEPELIKAFVQAHEEALRWMRQAGGEETWKTIATAFPDGDPEILAAATERYFRLGTWSSDAGLSPATYRSLTDALKVGGLIERIAPYEVAIRDCSTAGRSQ